MSDIENCFQTINLNCEKLQQLLDRQKIKHQTDTENYKLKITELEAENRQFETLKYRISQLEQENEELSHYKSFSMVKKLSERITTLERERNVLKRQVHLYRERANALDDKFSQISSISDVTPTSIQIPPESQVVKDNDHEKCKTPIQNDNVVEETEEVELTPFKIGKSTYYIDLEELEVLDGKGVSIGFMKKVDDDVWLEPVKNKYRYNINKSKGRISRIRT